jgi:phosphohistidine phosphatase SixA
VRVIVVRHAKAAPGEPDDLRPLTDQGREAARMLGELLAEREPDAVVSSPLLRARETALAIAGAAGLEADVDERLAPGADADDLRAAVDGRGETVVTAGHQPDCSEIVLALTGREVEFPTAGFAEIDL